MIDAGNAFEFVKSEGKNGRLLGGFWIQCTNNNPTNFPGCRNCAVRARSWRIVRFCCVVLLYTSSDLELIAANQNGAHTKGFRSYEWGVRCCKNLGATGGAPAQQQNGSVYAFCSFCLSKLLLCSFRFLAVTSAAGGGAR